MRILMILGGLLVGASLVAGCGDSTSSEEECEPDETYNPVIDPAGFASAVDNPLWPLTPGSTFVFAAGAETTTTAVTNQTKLILGVTCVVVHDVVTVNGELLEDTLDWYAEDTTGTVWYMGEDTKEYENGVVTSTEGSWEAGVDEAKPGVVMYANLPAPGTTYRQEYLVCEAEDVAEIVGTGRSVTVPYGTFASNCLETRETTRLEPGLEELKYYAPGIGLVLEVDAESGARTELISVTLAAP